LGGWSAILAIEKELLWSRTRDTPVVLEAVSRRAAWRCELSGRRGALSVFRKDINPRPAQRETPTFLYCFSCNSCECYVVIFEFFSARPIAFAGSIEEPQLLRLDLQSLVV
jgi:hypothetical protein